MFLSVTSTGNTGNTDSRGRQNLFKAVFQMQGHMRIEIYSVADFVLRVMFLLSI